MRIAVIADIHGNAVALDAVLTDLQRDAADQLVCLGDAVSANNRWVKLGQNDLRWPSAVRSHTLNGGWDRLGADR